MSQEQRKMKREGSRAGVKPREEEEETGERNVEAQANDEWWGLKVFTGMGGIGKRERNSQKMLRGGKMGEKEPHNE